MNATDTLQALLTTFSGNPLLGRLFFASVEFAALAVLVYGAIHLCRIRSPRLASMLWLLVLAKPIVSLAIGSPLPLIRMGVPPVAVANQTAVEVSERSNGRASFVQSTANSAEQLPRTGNRDDIAAGLVPQTTSTSASLLVDASATPVAAQSASSPGPWDLSTIILTAWLAGVALFMALSLLDRVRVRRLVRSSRVPDSQLSGRYHAVVSQLRLKRPINLRVTDALEGPALIGSVIPTILIPAWLADDSNSAKIDWALRHELMHWKLRDPFAGLVRELAQILFYFHPAAWWAGRQWEVSAEQACDRAIVHDETDSRDYAEQLYGILLGIQGRLRIPVKSGLFATRTQIGQRIAALLNGPRTAPHLGTLAVVGLTLLSAGAFCIGGAFAEKAAHPSAVSSGTHPAANEPKTQGENSKRANASADIKLLPSKEENGDVAKVRGRVVNPGGEPVAGVEVSVRRRYDLGNFANWFPITAATTGQNGQFELVCRKSTPGKPGYQPGEWKETVILAEANGFSLQWKSWYEMDASKPLVFQHVPDFPIRGRVVNLEGQPVAGVAVDVRAVEDPREGGLGPWLEQLKSQAGRVGASSPSFHLMHVLRDRSHPWAVSDKDGRFVIRGIEAERVAILVFSGESIAYRQLAVVTRRMQPIARRISEYSPVREQVYGADFTFPAKPTRPIVGTVRDAATGKPMAGVGVRFRHLDAFALVTVLSYPPIETDSSGQYRLVGLPKKKGNKIFFVPKEDQPYFRREVEVPDSNEFAPAKVDVDLHRGVWITARVTDQLTGKPVVARLSYYPFLDNPFARKLPEFARRMSFRDSLVPTMRADGTFRIVGLPGRAIVGARALFETYRSGVGASEIQGIDKNGRFPTYGYPVPPGGRSFNAVREINPPEGTQEVRCDFVLERGETVRVTVVDRNGTPVDGSSVDGRFDGSRVEKNAAATFDIINLAPGSKRPILICNEKLHIGKFFLLEFTDKTPRSMTVALEPCGTITGRLIDQNGVGLERIGLQAMAQQEGGVSAWAPPVLSRADGKFEYAVPLGCTYAIAEGGVVFIQNLYVESGKTIDVGEIKVRRRR